MTTAEARPRYSVQAGHTPGRWQATGAREANDLQTTPTPPPAARANLGPVERLALGLDRIARTVRTLLVVRALAWIGAGVVAAAVIIALIDLGLRLPGPARGVLLLVLLAGVVAAARTLVLPAWRLRPGRATLARRVERLDPSLAGQIAPAVDLLTLVNAPGQEGALARAGVARAGERVAKVDIGRIVRWTGVGGSLAALAAAAVVVAALGVWSPTMTGVGAARVLTPWTDASWPKRFGVTDQTGVEIHPVDEALAVRVAVGPAEPGARVRVEWRVGEAREITRTPMAAQPRAGENGRSFERLIDAGAIASAVMPSDDGDEPGNFAEAEMTLRYRIVTPDDRTAWRRVRLVRPPEVESFVAEITPPAHAADAPGLAGFRTGRRELSTGDTVLGPVLEGSEVTLVWLFSKPVTPADPDAWSPVSTGVDQPDARTVRVVLDAGTPTRIVPVVADEHGLGVRSSVSLGLDVRADALPGVAIAEPPSDEIVTAQADLTVRAEAGDDVGVVSLRVEAMLARPPAGSTGAGPEPIGEPVTLAEASIDTPVARAETTIPVRPADLGAQAGDEIVLVAIATDTRGESGLARSSERRLRVVSPEALSARLRAELNPLTRLLRRADDQQNSLMDRVRRDEEETGPLVREQIALSDTVASAARSVRDLDRSRQRNALGDPALESLLRDLGNALGEAQAVARDAAQSIEAGDTDQAQREQREARDRIGEALSMLDRGEDAFLARRAVSRIREQLAQAREDTARVGQRTAGQDANNLGPQDRADLDQLASDQAELADAVREVLEELTRRAGALERDDPAQAEALRSAAEQGRAGAVGSLIEQAGQQTGENQTGQAQQSQDEALAQLDEMLEQIDAAAALRDTALRRRLATLIASIGQLLATQTGELQALAAARDAAEALGRDNPLARAMIALRDNTLGVMEEASAELAELRLIAELLREAEGAQAQAAGRLRNEPPALDRAETHEQASLAALERALEEAKRQDEAAQNREQDRVKAELRQAYRDALERQIALRDESLPLTGRALDRRERVEARRLSASQTELADTLVGVRERTAEISEAPVFTLAHDRLDDLMRAAGAGLAEASPGAGVTLDQQQATAILASLVEVLADSGPDQDQDFQDGQGGGGEGGGGGQPEPLIPPIAELRLLRDMQRSAMDTTRTLGEDPNLAADTARLGRLGDLQRLLAERGLQLIEKLNQQPAPGEQTPAEPPEQAEPGEPDESGGSREPSEPDAG